VKVLLVILDGLGDRPSPLLDGRTPLEAAHTPNLDRLAEMGITGFMTPLSPGVVPSSPLAHFLLFGYRLEEFPGRAVFLAVSHGLELTPDEVVCAARLATVELHVNGLRIIERLVHYGETDSRQLAEAIAHYEVGGLRFELRYTGDSEGTLFIRGGASLHITDSDPLGRDLPVIRIQPMVEASDVEQAQRTAKALNHYLSWAYHRLSQNPINQQRRERGQLPANFLLTKWTARRRAIEPFAARWGFRAASVTSEGILRGVASELGMTHVAVSSASAVDEDLRCRLVAAQQLFTEGYDFVHVHTKEPDVTSHLGDPVRKLKVIESLDRGLATLFTEMLPDPELVLIVTADHCTPSVWSTPAGEFHDQHSSEPVPIVALSRYARVDDVTHFDERAVLRGGLGHISGTDLMPLVLNLSARTNTCDQRPLDHHVLYRPRQVEAFEIMPDESE